MSLKGEEPQENFTDTSEISVDDRVRLTVKIIETFRYSDYLTTIYEETMNVGLMR